MNRNNKSAIKGHNKSTSSSPNLNLGSKNGLKSKQNSKKPLTSTTNITRSLNTLIPSTQLGLNTPPLAQLSHLVNNTKIHSLFQTQKRQLSSTNLSEPNQFEGDILLGPHKPQTEMERTIPLSSLKKSYLLDHPEVALRAQFARIPTREEVTGLTPDPVRDKQKFKLPGQQVFKGEKMLPVRDDHQAKLITPRQTSETLKLALNTSESKLTESLLSLALVEPLPYKPTTDLEAARVNITKELSIAPSRDVDIQKQQSTALGQVKSSERIFKGDLTQASEYLKKRIKEAEENNLPYFKPTGNVQIDEMNKRNLQKGILPIPNFAGDQNNEITPDDITQIDQMAQSLARHVEVSTSAKQPYDTASKIVNARLADLPLDAQEFFASAGFPTIDSRTPLAYSRYLRLLSKRGTITQVLDIFDEIRGKGLPFNSPMAVAVIGALQLLNPTPQDNERMLKEMILNKPNLDKTATYIKVPDYIGSVSILPKSTEPINGAPNGFVSCAPNIASYGAPGLRGYFNPTVEYAFYLFEKAKENGTIPSKHLVTSVMQVCGEHAQFERAFALLEEYKRYAEGQIIDAKLQTPKRELMLAKPHRDAKLQGFDVDHMMVVVLMNACLHSRRPELVEETFHQFWESGLQPNAPMFNQVIISCVKGGYVEKAFKYFEQLQHFGHTPSIITYSSLIRACSAPDRPEFYPKAFEVFHECVSAGFRPDRILFNDLLKVTVAQADVNNLVQIFRLMTRDFPHLIDIDVYTLVATGLAKSMSDEKLAGFGGYVLTKNGRTLFGQTITGIAEEDAELNGSKKIKLTREDRLAMIDALYSEVILRTESQDRTGGMGGRPLRITPRFLQAVISGYANAAAGILRWDRHERKEGREDPLLRLTPAHIDQLIERTWNKVVTLQKQHPHVFVMDQGTYRSLWDMYGAADRMDDAVYHLLYLTRGLKLPVYLHTYTGLLDWCEKNAHHGPALVIMDEMHQNGMPCPLKYKHFFQKKDQQSQQPLVPNSFPTSRIDPDDREAQWQQPRRDRKTGKMVNHPMDWDVSYKDF